MAGAGAGVLDEAGPGGGQGQQPQRVPGRRGVEDNVVVLGQRIGRADQLGELLMGMLMLAAVGYVAVWSVKFVVSWFA